MKYEVVLMPSAKADIFEIRAWLMEFDEDAADRWLWKCSEAVTSLQRFPMRCRISDESVAFDVDVRELIFGIRKNNYRILFAIEGRKVNILRIRSTRQRSLSDEAADDVD